MSTYKHRNKICGQCGKELTTNWSRHWKNNHPREIPFEGLLKDKATYKRQKTDDNISSKDIQIDASNIFSKDIQIDASNIDSSSDQQSKFHQSNYSSLSLSSLYQKLKDLERQDVNKMTRERVVMQLADQMQKKDLAVLLTKNDLPCLRQTLITILPNNQITVGKRVGLLTAMLAQSIYLQHNSGQLIEHIKQFVAFLDTEKTQVLDSLDTAIQICFYNQRVAQWITNNISFLRPDLLQLLNHLSLTNSYDVSDILKIARLVQFWPQMDSADLDYFIEISGWMIESMNWVWFSKFIDNTNQPRLQFDYYCSLSNLMVNNLFKSTVRANNHKLQAQSMSNWLKLIHEMQAESTHASDNKSIRQIINELQHDPKLKCLTYTDQFIESFALLFKSTQTKPSNYQIGLGLHVASTIKTTPFTLWGVTAGCGKSRIIATTALALLEQYDNVVVHFVIPGQSLMDRDKAAFSDYWEASDTKNRVNYHCNLSFQQTENDIVIIDEADYFVYSDPQHLHNLSKQCKCILFTSTSKTHQIETIEDSLLTALSIKTFNVEVPGFDWKPTFPVDMQFQIDSKEGINFIQTKQQSMPVLVYGTEQQAKELVNLQNVVRLGVSVDHSMLSRLNEFVVDGVHPLVLTTMAAHMRGLDFRAQTGICLIVGTSFVSDREATQGLQRVGRFGDSCERYLNQSTALVDENIQSAIRHKLVQFVRSQNQIAKTTLESIKKEKQKKNVQPADMPLRQQKLLFNLK